VVDLDGRTLPTFCPFCGQENDCNQGVRKPAAPKCGDVAICWHCSGVMVFDTPTRVRRPTPEEQAEFKDDPQISLVLGVMRESYTPYEAVALTRQVFRGANRG
jgi:hypothetical protein